MPVQEEIISWSEDLIKHVKLRKDTKPIQKKLAELNLEELVSALGNDKARLVFWINCYNAYYQILATQDQNVKNIYTDKSIKIAQIFFSLDDIEHGILRKYRSKYSLGYLPQFFPAVHICKLAVNQIDYRIHFALNCGAKSCPPIFFYNYNNLDDQLDLAAASFLAQETFIDKEKKRVETTALFQWFRADFGGMAGIKKVLGKYVNENFSTYKIIFKDYDWSSDLHHFADENQNLKP